MKRAKKKLFTAEPEFWKALKNTACPQTTEEFMAYWTNEVRRLMQQNLSMYVGHTIDESTLTEINTTIIKTINSITINHTH